MNLLLTRGQTYGAFSLVPLRIGRGALFTLKAELELTSEEQELINKYRLSGSLISDGDGRSDFRRALPSSLVCTIGMAIVLSLLSPISIFSGAGLFALLIVFIGAQWFAYNQLKEKIYISDLLNGGRGFVCDSVVDLIKKEAYLQSVSRYLRQLLESAKTWGEREKIEIKPLSPEEAKLAVLRAS